MKDKKKIIIISICILVVILIALAFLFFYKKNDKNVGDNINEATYKNENTNETKKEEKKNESQSNSRPYAVVINNFAKAVKAQSGLDKAYVVYEFPIEGGISRSLALYKDQTDVKIGTIRSARQNYIDYALENDAIFVHFGWNVTAKEQIKKLKIDYIDGNSSDPKPFNRENPLKLAREHTVYTNISKIMDYAKKNKKYRLTTNTTPVFSYSEDEINLDDGKKAKEVKVPYSNSFNVKFVYNDSTKRYERYVNGNKHTDYFNKKTYDCKNILVVLVGNDYIADHKDAAGNNYLNLKNIGTGTGYYITNGYSKKIKWQKKSKESKTIYSYEDGSELKINDGNTWVMMQLSNLKTSIS